MKKLLLSFVLVTSIFSFAYTSIDVENANYLASKNIITPQIYETKYRLDDLVTRAEIVGIALKMKGVVLPADYTCKNYFSDVRFVPFSNDQWICRAVELAADAGFVSRANTIFRPQDQVTRAEAFSIIYKASGLYPFKEYGTFMVKDTDANSWQIDLFMKIHNTNINIPGEKFITTNTPAEPVYFYPNRSATRAEVFEFVAKNIIKQSETITCTPNSPNFVCGPVTQGMEYEPNYIPPQVCGCKPATCPEGQSVIISSDVGYWSDGSAKGIFTCSSEYPA